MLNNNEVLLYLLTVIVGLVLCISSFWNYRLLRKTKQQLKIQIQLREIEKELRAKARISNQTNSCIFATDLDGKLNFWNKGSERMFGYQAGEIMGKHLSIICPSQNCKFLHKFEVSQLVEKEFEIIATRLQHKGREIFHGQLSFSLNIDEHGNAVGMVVSVVDISELMEAMGALKNIKHTLDHTLDCIFIFDAMSLKFTYVNEGAIQQTGYSNEELLAMHPYDIKPEYNEIKFRKEINPLLKDNKITLNFKTCHQNKAGTIIPVEVYLKYISLKDTEPYFVAIVRDVAGYEMVEKIQKAARIGHWSLNTLTNEVWASNEIYNIFELYGVVITPESFIEIVHPDDRAKVEASLQQGRNGENRDIEFRYIDSKNNVRWLRGVGGVIRNDSGKVVEVFGTIQDVTESKQIEEALKESQALLEKAQGLSKTGHWKLDISTGEITGSDELFNMFCLSPENSTLETFMNVVHPDDREISLDAIKRGIEHGEGWDIKHRLSMGDGEEKWLHAVGDAITDDEGNVVELLSTMQDITQQRRIEDEIEKSSARFEIMFESIPDAVVFVDVNNKIKIVNKAFNQIFGFTKKDVKGMSFECLNKNSDKKHQVNRCTKMLRQSYEINYQNKAGKIFKGETVSAPLIASDGEVLGKLAIIRDISERTHVDAVFRSLAAAGSGLECNSFMHDILERITEVYNCEYAFIGQLEGDGSVQTLAVRAHGKVADNFKYLLVDTPCEDLLKRSSNLIPHSASTIYSKDKMLADMGIESYFGCPLITSNGTCLGLLSVMGTSSLELDDWTEPVLGVFATRISLELERDLAIQELHQHQQHLEELVNKRTVDLSIARDEAERANEAKSEFLSHMSHELRTPLNAILGFAQILELDAEDFNEGQRSDINEILEAGRHLLTLINEVLDLAKIESGSMQVSMQKVNINELLLECVSLVSNQAENHKIKIINNISNGNVLVWADATKLKQAVLNLLSNAIKYNRRGGQVNLTCVRQNKKYLRINVIDTGEGLTKEEVSRLFTAFDRIKASSKIEGAGIGLVISRHMIELMNGRMGVESKPSEGSCFWLEIEYDRDEKN